MLPVPRGKKTGGIVHSGAEKGNLLTSPGKNWAIISLWKQPAGVCAHPPGGCEQCGSVLWALPRRCILRFLAR